MSKKRPTLDWL